MKHFLLFGLCLLSLFLFFYPARRPSAVPSTDAAQIKHGEYIVLGVAMCAGCHSPYDEKGALIEDRLLQGASLTFKPTIPIPNWADYAPPLVGLPGLSDAQAITFLTTGKYPSGEFAKPPMPGFRMNREDAAAVVAYLRSLHH
jgi:mono/diheme cytochrome c family protein